MKNLIALIVMAVSLPAVANTIEKAISFRSNTIHSNRLAAVDTSASTTTGDNATPVVPSECRDQFTKCLNISPDSDNTEECLKNVRDQPGCSNFVPKGLP